MALTTMRTSRGVPQRASLIALLGIAGLMAASCSSTRNSAASSSGSTGSGGASAAIASTKATYKIAIVTSLTGQAAPNGIPAEAGFEAAIDQVNASGGVDGHKIVYHVIDDQSTPSGAATAGQQAVAEKPIAILDGSTSAFIADRLSIYKSAKVPVLSANATSFGLQPWLYSTSPTPAQAARALVGAAGSALGKSLSGARVALVSIATAGGEAQLNSEKALMVQQGAVISNTSLNPQGTPSFAAAAANIVASNPAVVTLLDSAADSVVEAKALLGAGFKGPIVGYFLSSDSGTFKAIGSPQYLAMRFNADATPGTGMYAAAQKFGFTSGTSNLLFGSTWALTYMLTLGLEKCGSACNTPAAVEQGIDSLGSFSVPGGAEPFGNLLVNSTTHNVTVYEQLYKWDATSQAVVSYGAPVPLGMDDYTASS